MINVIITFRVFDEHLPKTINIIKTFVNEVNANEIGTHFYKSFQSQEDPTKFTHVMSFEDEIAQDLHRNSTYCLKFVEELYPLCSETPKPINYNEIH